MKLLLPLILFITNLQITNAQINNRHYPVYHGDDLGLTYSPNHSSFRLWSPRAEAVELLLYKHPTEGRSYFIVSLVQSDSGTWYKQMPGDLQGVYYTFSAKINGKWSDAVPDPYAKAAGTNGLRAMVTDLKLTDPHDWKKDKSPDFSRNNLATDAVIYELQIRDASIDENSGIQHKGKYLGLAEQNTSFNGVSTGLAHLKELGVTHIHLLPFFDFNSIDESKPEKPQYNWGYDPQNYNIPEGSFSTNPSDGITRIKELKTMIAAMHKAGLRVVMDVVYNHVSQVRQSNFEQLVPGYYFRQKADGSFSDASACGNETASERPMMRKFMIESLLYWVKEYHMDGFRFDLMGIHDIETMNQISKALHEVKPDILLYGEGWAGGDSPLPESLRAVKKNDAYLDRIAVFSDDIRDGIKGSVFKENENGFVSGNAAKTISVKFGIVAACQHPQIDYSKVNYSTEAYSPTPAQTINYCECHDNNTLWDKLKNSNPTSSEEELKKMHKLATTIVLSSQGIPFLHAGTEFYRTKQGVENSYNKPDSINKLDWKQKVAHKEMVDYTTQLITMRKDHPGFRMRRATDIADNIVFDNSALNGTIVYTINAGAVGDSWKKIWVCLNGTSTDINMLLPWGNWMPAIEAFGNKKISDQVNVGRYAALILYQK